MSNNIFNIKMHSTVTKFTTDTLCSYKIWHMNCLPLGQKRAVISFNLTMPFAVQKFCRTARKLLLLSLWPLHWDDLKR
jgi:hypothetical protein